MLPTDIRLTGTELTFISVREMSGAHLDAVGVLINPADHLSGCEPGFGVVSSSSGSNSKESDGDVEATMLLSASDSSERNTNCGMG